MVNLNATSHAFGRAKLRGPNVFVCLLNRLCDALSRYWILRLNLLAVCSRFGVEYVLCGCFEF